MKAPTTINPAAAINDTMMERTSFREEKSSTRLPSLPRNEKPQLGQTFHLSSQSVPQFWQNNDTIQTVVLVKHSDGAGVLNMDRSTQLIGGSLEIQV
jgi:hypothetical protein